MREIKKLYGVASRKYTEAKIDFKVMVDGVTMLHELKEDLYCNDPVEIELTIRYLNERD